MLTATLQTRLQQLQETGLYRQRRVLPEVGLNFSRSDYLSLSHHPKIREAYQRGYVLHPVSSAGSPLICGYHVAHRALERAFSEALAVDDCLLFSSGYAANLGLMQLLGALDATILMDKSIHASFYDGLKSSGARYLRYRHQDPIDFEKKITQSTDTTVLLTESVFSMSGHQAPLAKMSSLAHHKHITFMVDEAHAFGVLGNEGLGGVVAERLTQSEIPLRIIPLGKAFAASGAVIAGSGIWIEALQQYARAYMYSTAISPAVCFGLMHTLGVIRQADDRRAHLRELITYFQSVAQQSGLHFSSSSSAIQLLQLGCPKKATYYAEYLLRQGIVCMPVRQPTVTKPETGLRIVLNAHHHAEDIDRLFDVIRRVDV